MNKDKAIEELFLANKPHFDDGEDFMAALTKRIDAVEYIKQHQEVSIRRYKAAVVAAFAVGIVSGAITIAFLLSMPTNAQLFSFHVQTGFPLWIAEHSRLLAITTLSLLMTLGIISIINNVNDIIQWKKNES